MTDVSTNCIFPDRFAGPLSDMLAAYWCQEFGGELRGDTLLKALEGQEAFVRQYGRRGPTPLTGPSRCDPPAERRANSSCLKSRSRRALQPLGHGHRSGSPRQLLRRGRRPLLLTRASPPVPDLALWCGSGPIRACSFSRVCSAANSSWCPQRPSGARASVGTIAGTDMVRFAASATQLVIVANGSAYAL